MKGLLFIVERGVEFARGKFSGGPRARASMYYASSSIICQGLRFLGVLLSTRLILPDQFGLYAQACIALAFMSVIREIGQSNAFVSYDGEDRRYAVFSFQLNAILGIAAALVLLTAAHYMPMVPMAVRRAAPILATAVVVENLTQTALLDAQKKLRFLFLGCVDIAAVSTWTITLAVCVWHVEGFIAILLAQLAELLVRFACLMGTGGWRNIGWAGGRDLRSYYFVRFARTMVPQIFLQSMATNMDLMLLSHFSTLWELGVYERMLKFIRIPWSLSINLLDRVLLVSYSKAQKNGAELQNVLRKGQGLIAWAVVGAVGAVTIGIVFLLKFVLGPEWPPIIQQRWWISIPFTIAIPFVWNFNLLFQGVGCPKQLLKNIAVPVVLELAGGIMTVPRFGAAGMLATRGVTHIVLIGYQITAVPEISSGGSGSRGTSLAPFFWISFFVA